jgi:aconitate hydratase
MMRGTFANIRIKNEIIPGTEGGITKFFEKDEQMSIYDAAIEYNKKNIPLVVIAGKEYGTGSSRDWAAKGTKLLGIKAVIAESFERIHRSNLIGMGVLPLQFIDGQNKKLLELNGSDIISINGLDSISPNSEVDCEIKSIQNKHIKLLCRIDTIKELDYYRQGGILQYVLNSIIKKAS